MKNIVIINLLDKTRFFDEKIDNVSQKDRIQQYIQTLPDIEDVFVFLKEDMDIPYKKIVNNSWNEEIFMDHIQKLTVGFKHLFYFFGDLPLIDSKLTNEMYSDHCNYFAEYTFADGYPYGLTPEILDIEIINALKVLSKGSLEPVNRETIFNIVKKDINSFELETKIAKNDQRLKRVSLTLDSKRNFNQLKKIIELGGVDADTITEIIDTESEILFQEPSYLTLEITKSTVQEVSYLPKRVQLNRYMELENLDIILKKVKVFSEDITVAFTPEYEPSTHPEILTVINNITKKYGFSLYIETSGIGWDSKVIQEIITNDKVFVIVTLDANDTNLYRQLRGEGQGEAETFTHMLIKEMKKRVWVQATRMKLNEVNMEPFYRYWQKYTEQIIIQKYSDYNGRLPDLKVADLSPLKRFPCWHLKRDLHINTEGEALMCFYDINSETSLGSLITEDIEVIMKRKKQYYLEQVNCEYTGLCRNCDEYYTFNF